MRSLKNKRVLWAVLAVVFVFALFFIKNKTLFINSDNGETPGQNLAYDKRVVGDLINQDTDKDGIPDWEESLWSTDPYNSDTNSDGIGDDTEITREKAKKEAAGGLEENENLTQTDKFAQELLATVVALNQAGEMDQVTADKLGSSLAEQIENSTPRKVFLLSEIKTTTDGSAQAFKNYYEELASLQEKYPLKESVIDILAESMANNDGIEVSVLAKLDPIIKQVKAITDGMLKMNTPQKIASLHWELINNFQQIEENLNDIKLVDTDTVVAFKAISQFGNNTEKLQNSIDQLLLVIKQKLNT